MIKLLISVLVVGFVMGVTEGVAQQEDTDNMGVIIDPDADFIRALIRAQAIAEIAENLNELQRILMKDIQIAPITAPDDDPVIQFEGREVRATPEELARAKRRDITEAAEAAAASTIAAQLITGMVVPAGLGLPSFGELLQRAFDFHSRFETNELIRIPSFSINLGFPPSMSVDFEFVTNEAEGTVSLGSLEENAVRKQLEILREVERNRERE